MARSSKSGQVLDWQFCCCCSILSFFCSDVAAAPFQGFCPIRNAIYCESVLHLLHANPGTPLFLPPEMFMRHWGPEADLWSLGMVTYLLLSGNTSQQCGFQSNVTVHAATNALCLCSQHQRSKESFDNEVHTMICLLHAQGGCRFGAVPAAALRHSW